MTSSAEHGRLLGVRGLAAGLVVASLVGLPAWAADTPAAEASRLVKLSATQFEAGEYEAAASSLAAAYQLAPSGRVLFNLARAQEKAGKLTEAIESYETYLRRPDAEVKPTARARESLLALYKLQAARSAPPPPPIVTAPPPADAPTPPKLVPVEPAPQVLVVAPPPPAPASSGLRTVGIVAVVVGGVALAVASGLGAAAASNAATARGSGSIDERLAAKERAYALGTATDVSFAVGGGVAATGVLLWVLAPSGAPP